MLSGSPAQQTAALRQYLVQLVRELKQAEAAASPQQGQNSRPGVIPGAPGSDSTENIRQTAQQLRSLIQKTAADAEKYTDIQIGGVERELINSAQSSKNYADGKVIQATTQLSEEIRSSANEVKGYIDGQISTFSERYVARSEFGAYQENARLEMQTTAKGVVEGYSYDSRIASVQSGLDLMQQFQTSIEGQIRRGILIDPDTGLEVLGIAISQTLQFTGDVKEQNGEKYYYLSPGQTLGFYTSTGWQFWINGCRCGWYDSVDSMLHVASQTVEDKLFIGDKWRLSAAKGLRIEYVGE